MLREALVGRLERGTFVNLEDKQWIFIWSAVAFVLDWPFGVIEDATVRLRFHLERNTFNFDDSVSGFFH